MYCSETDDCIELLHILELGVQVLLEVAHLGLRTVLFLGNLDQIIRNVVAIELLDFHTVFLQFFLYIVGLLPIAAA